jgi:hypothetical protein
MAITIANRDAAHQWHADNDPDAPKAGEAAPDFELADISGSARVRLSELTREKPVALVFGSFT